MGNEVGSRLGRAMGLGEFFLSCGETHVSNSCGTSLQDRGFAGETLEHPASFIQ